MVSEEKEQRALGGLEFSGFDRGSRVVVKLDGETILKEEL